MEANFELFEEGQVVGTRGRVHVTLNKECKLFFNATAVEALGGPDGVALFFDKRKKIIGVMPTALNRSHAFRLRQQFRGSRSRVITMRNFCRRYDLKPTETLAFPNASINKDGIMVLDLQDVRVVKATRVKK